ncbi:protein kinase domain-containing protein [Roseateles sp.]|uniref:serine/threonine-protein kinase n=1 Tax=Roseateles sp. TaxID=1971397 RepID=UPI0039ED598C
MPGQTAISRLEDGTELPRFLSHYELRRVLGRGGFSIVYEAWDARLCRAVAIKCLLRAERGPQGSLHEARMTARVKHPAFVTIYELLHHEGRTFLVMELIDGRTLSEITADGPVSTDIAQRWAWEAAVAIHAAHAGGVVHGDIKPSNLMVDAQGQVRILDLGLATTRDPCATQDLSALGENAGTLAYMAPELLLGAPPSTASDVFSLGLTLYRIVAGPGRVPASTLALAHQRLAQDLELVAAGVDSRFLELLQEMTRRDPAMRLTELGVVAARLCRLNGADAPPAVAPRRAALRAWRAAGLLVVALVLVGAGILLRPDGVPIAPRDVAAAERSLRLPDDTVGIDRAIVTLEAVLAAEHTPPARVAALLAVAYCLRYAGNGRDPVWLDRAAASAQLALRTEDQLALAHTAQAWVLELQEQLDAAQREYAHALSLDPHDFHALNGQAQLLIRQGRADAALAVFQRALGRYPDEPVFLNGLGPVNTNAIRQRSERS